MRRRGGVWVVFAYLLLGSGVASGDNLCAFNNVNQLLEATAVKRVAPKYPTPMLRKNVSGCVVFAFGLTEGADGKKLPTGITVVHATREGRSQFVRAGRKALKNWEFHGDLASSATPRYFAAILFQMKALDSDEPDTAEGLRL